MEIIKVLWIATFFFFALVLLFTWSKVALISGKIKAINRLIESIDNLSGQPARAMDQAHGQAGGDSKKPATAKQGA